MNDIGEVEARILINQCAIMNALIVVLYQLSPDRHVSSLNNAFEATHKILAEDSE